MQPGTQSRNYENCVNDLIGAVQKCGAFKNRTGEGRWVGEAKG